MLFGFPGSTVPVRDLRDTTRPLFLGTRKVPSMSWFQMLRLERLNGNGKAALIETVHTEVVTRECQREVLEPWDVSPSACIHQKTLSLNTLDTPPMPG